MKILVDTNVILDHLLERDPFAKEAWEVLETCRLGKCDGYVAWHSLSNIHYIASLSQNHNKLRPLLTELTQYLTVATVGHVDFRAALSFPMGDFEDAMQAAAAKACDADYIVTRNTKDFRYSPVTPMEPAEWLDLLTS